MTFSSILITGASSGIGEALALVYARPGTTIVLTGRNQERLDAVALACRAAGAAAAALILDVTDEAAMATALTVADDSAPFDLVIANAGISAGTGGGSEQPDQVRAITRINVDGVVNTVAPLLPRLVARRRGQIALMGSLAAYRGFPGAPAYCASKAWVRSYGQSLRAEFASAGVGVTVISPGFVRSRMTSVNRFRMSFLMDADRAARIIRDGLARNRAEIAFPWPMSAAARLLGILPSALALPLLTALPRKGSGIL